MSLGLSISLYLKRAPLGPLHRALWRTPVRLVPSAAVFQELYLGFTPAAMCLEAFLLPTSLLLTSWLSPVQAFQALSPLLKYWIRKKRENKAPTMWSMNLPSSCPHSPPFFLSQWLLILCGQQKSTPRKTLRPWSSSGWLLPPSTLSSLSSSWACSWLPVACPTLHGDVFHRTKPPSPAHTSLLPGILSPLRKNSNSGSCNLLFPNLKCLS